MKTMRMCDGGIPLAALWMALQIYVCRGDQPQEYCLREVFNATCGPTEVILVNEAHFGLPRLGRCAPRDYGGQLGCANDVTKLLDARCSGRRRCHMDVIELDRLGLTACAAGIKTYLVASYTCVTVATGTYHQCRGNKRILLDDNAGYISSLVTLDKGFGGSRCPWSIRVKPGQQIQITAFYFNTSASSSSCPLLAVVSENGQQRNINICGGHKREKAAFLSEANVIEVEVMMREQTPPAAHFLLQYEAVGCEMPYVPVGAYLNRHNNQASIICNSTGKTFHVSCIDGSWSGHIQNCSSPDKLEGWEESEYDWTSPLGLIIVVGLGVVIGVILGVLLLAIVMMWMKKHRNQDVNRQESHYDDVMDPPEGGSTLPYYPHGDPYKMGQYADIWRNQVTEQSTLVTGQDKVLVTTGHGSHQSVSPGSSVPMLPGEKMFVGTGTLTRGKHCYESPKFKRVEYYSKTEAT